MGRSDRRVEAAPTLRPQVGSACRNSGFSAVVTGAGRGLGREHALFLASHGARVVVNDLGSAVDGEGADRSPGEQVVDEIRAAGGEAVFSGHDVSNWDEAGEMIRLAIESFGDLHVLVNNAGILRDRTLANMTEAEWDAVIKVHLKGHADPSHHAVKHWRRQAKSGQEVRASLQEEFRMSSPVRVERNGKVLEIILDRPKANAIDVHTSRALGEVFVGFRDDPDLLVAILTGAGEKFFSGGWDLKAAAGGEGVESDFGPGGFAGLTEIFDLNKPVIAAVNGYAIGGGFELALACDLIVAAEHALFYLPEAGWGIVPAAGGVQRLPRRLPYAVAMEMMLTGRRMGAPEAAQHGLVNRVVPLAKLLETSREMAGQIAEKAPLSIMAIKQVVRETEEVNVEEAFRLVRSGAFSFYEKVVASEDAKEGPRSFAEKRKPNFKGR